MKSWLMSDGHELYAEIWCDQPALHTTILSNLFRLTGPSILTSRMLTVAFSVLLVACFFDVVQYSSGFAVAIVSTLLLVISQYFVQLSVSAMIVLPAMAMAVLSLWAATKGYQTGKAVWVGVSGIAMGLGLQVKISAGLFVPAITYALASAAWHCTRQNTDGSIKHAWWTLALKYAVIWCMAAMAVWLSVAMSFTAASTEQLLGTHFSASTQASFPPDESVELIVEAVQADISSWIAAFVALVCIAWLSHPHGVTAAILLFTTACFHLVHQPYWWYYYLHLAIPLAWLEGIALRELLRTLTNQHATRMAVLAAFLALCGILSLLVCELEPKLRDVYQQSIARPLAAECAGIHCLTSIEPKPHFVVTRNALHAFHAGVRVPPPLAVWSRKRVASGQLNEGELLRAIAHYKPEYVDSSIASSTAGALYEHLKTHYVESSGESLWRRRTATTAL